MLTVSLVDSGLQTELDARLGRLVTSGFIVVAGPGIGSFIFWAHAGQLRVDVFRRRKGFLPRNFFDEVGLSDACV